MSDGIWIQEDGASMMYVGETPWHGLGTRLDKLATAEEAMRAARLDWEVRKLPVYARSDDGYASKVDGKFATVPAHLWGKPGCPVFGIVGAEYQPLQNCDAFEFFDPIVGEGAAVYETAGALDDGKRVWMLAKLPDDMLVADSDLAQKYLLLSNNHAGEGSVQVKFTPIRVVCQNTLTQALSTGPTLRVAHNANLQANLEVARENLKLIRSHYGTIEQTFKAMVATPVDRDRLTMYLRTVIPDPTGRPTEAVWNRVLRDRKRAADLFKDGKGNNLAGVAGTLWAAYNGITESVDHQPTRRSADQRLNHIWFGGGADLKARAYKEAVRLMLVWKTIKPAQASAALGAAVSSQPQLDKP